MAPDPIQLQWRRPRGCDTSSCVETAQDERFVYVRDSKDPGGPVLSFTHEEWAAHIADVMAESGQAPT